MMKKNLTFLPLVLLLTLLSGCGYRIGYLGHPQLRSVAIAPVVNDTLAYNVASQMRSLLSECFQTDGTMKLESVKKADCIVYARVTSISFSELSWSSTKNDTNIPNQWRVQLSAEFSVVLPGRAEPLLKNVKASGNAEFMSGPDIEISRNYAIRQACFVAAKDIVSKVTEAW
ncbi:MAG: hypothetical protein IJU70_02355 [Lentisphaeria bacterium]|nr:hypothetical protein [Lentisphaeria bacterium]